MKPTVITGPNASGKSAMVEDLLWRTAQVPAGEGALGFPACITNHLRLG